MAIRSSSIIVELLDRVSGPARRAATSLRGLGKSARDLPSAVNVGTRLDAAMARNAAAMGRARLGVVDAVATYYALDAAIGAPIRTAAAFETQLEDIGQKAGIPVEQFAALGRRIQQVGRDTNQASSQIASAVDAMASRGADIDTALTVANPIGKAATAYRASTEDMAAAAWSAVDNLKVPADQVGRAIDMMALTGKEGAFELRDMAQYFPALGAAYQGLGQSGVEAVGDLAAALQVVRKGTGDSASAATNLQNVLQKMRSPTTVRAFKRMGVSLEQELAGAAKRGLTPIEAIADVTAKTLDGDLSKLGYLFEDAQVQAGMRSLIQGMDEYQRIRDKAFRSKGVVDADYNRRIETANGAMERWAATTERFQISIAAALLPALSDVLDTVTPMIDKIGELAQAHPDLTEKALLAAGALVSLKVAAAGLSFFSLLGKGGALSMLAAGLKGVGVAAAASATVVETSAARMKRAFGVGGLGRMALKGTAIGSAVYLGLSPKPANVGPNGETEDQMLDKSTAVMAALSDAERKALHDAEQARAMAGISVPLVATDRRIANLKEDAAALREYIAEIQAEIDNVGIGPLTDQLTAPMRQRLDAEQAKLDAVTAELQAVQAEVETTGSAISGLAGINPAIRIDMTALDAALRKVVQIRAGLGGLGGTPPSDGTNVPAGARAKGGPVSPGRTYLVGERGPEPFTPTRSGYVHPAGAGRGSTPVTVAPVFYITGGSGASAETIADEVMRRMEKSVAAGMRGAMADVGG
jgi:TP901 family phage tail tape measure protein